MKSPISGVDVRQMSATLLEQRIAELTGLNVTVSKDDLLDALAKRGTIELPIASAASAPIQHSGVVPLAVPNDVNITYSRPLNGGGRTTLTVCRSLNACADTGALSNAQNSQTKFGWPEWGGTWTVSMWCD